MKIKPWLLASRPKTYAASIAPVLVGTGLAYHIKREVPWTYAACALFGALFIQIATNFINDALDFKKGVDTHERLGPLRVTQAGLLGADAVMIGGYVCLSVAAIFGVPLIIRGGWPIVLIGLGSVVAAYAYTGGPYPIAYHGLGEPFVLAFFGLIAVMMCLTHDPHDTPATENVASLNVVRVAGIAIPPPRFGRAACSYRT